MDTIKLIKFQSRQGRRPLLWHWTEGCMEADRVITSLHRAVTVTWDGGPTFISLPSGPWTASGKIPVSEVCGECRSALMRAWTAVEG